jgi:putative spermidine/putrescine transport system ATP-binding protein
VQAASPAALYDDPADAFVAQFVGRANLIDATATGPQSVATPIGALMTNAHGATPRAALRLLVRPERIVVDPPHDAENAFPARVLRDRFFGATRQVEVAVGQGRLEVETTARARVERVGLPREAIQFLDNDRSRRRTS